MAQCFLLNLHCFGLEEGGNVHLHSICSAGGGKDAKRPA